jgi:hypothetical protein
MFVSLTKSGYLLLHVTRTLLYKCITLRVLVSYRIISSILSPLFWPYRIVAVLLANPPKIMDLIPEPSALPHIAARQSFLLLLLAVDRHRLGNRVLYQRMDHFWGCLVRDQERQSVDLPSAPTRRWLRLPPHNTRLLWRSQTSTSLPPP